MSNRRLEMNMTRFKDEKMKKMPTCLISYFFAQLLSFAFCISFFVSQIYFVEIFSIILLKTPLSSYYSCIDGNEMTKNSKIKQQKKTKD